VETDVTSVYDRTIVSKAKTIVNVGGAGSSKSWSIAQVIIDKFVSEEDKTFLIARKTMPALKRSSYGLIIDFLKEADIYEDKNHNKTDHVYRFKKDGWAKENEMWFMSLDEPTKAKSLKSGVNYIWLEEADEFTFDDFMTFSLQLRKHTKDIPNQIYLSFNPIDGNGWIPTKLIPQDNVEVIHSTIDDNPMADADYVAYLDAQCNVDENYYKIYRLGEWGRLENIIFPKYTLVDEMPKELDEWNYGLDFGYVHPTALTKCGLQGDKLYWHQTLFSTGLTNSDIIERLSHFDRGDIFADNAEPDRIEEICRAGYNAYPANKDVKLGIDTVNGFTIHITKESIELIKQIRGYQRKKDKDGRVLEEPVKAYDDAIDAGRYGTMGLLKVRFATAKPWVRKSKHSIRM